MFFASGAIIDDVPPSNIDDGTGCKDISQRVNATSPIEPPINDEIAELVKKRERKQMQRFCDLKETSKLTEKKGLAVNKNKNVSLRGII